MPVYTYQCEECGQRFDARQKFTDDPITVCPECHGPTHKVIGSVGVVFKGSGFYVNDSRANNPANEPTKRSEKSEESSHSAKSESKPAATAKAKTETPAATSQDSD